MIIEETHDHAHQYNMTV